MAIKQSRTRIAVCHWYRPIVAAMLALVALAPVAASAQPSSTQDGQSWSGYQRKSSWSGSWHDNRRDDRRSKFNNFSPQVNAGWFQRPYPYHLDYYKMKWGGSYAPYFGNLYGPPNISYQTPYYGDYSPYYGGYGGYGYPPPNGGGYGGYGPAYGVPGYGYPGPFAVPPGVAPGDPSALDPDGQPVQPPEIGPVEMRPMSPP
jgi:hypothetical protein